jgi:hypothetical protein
MIKYLKMCWETFKEVQDLRAKAILKGHHWY